jgi:hypothetical protein
MTAASPDPKLISLVPTGAQLVAGISAPSFHGQPNNVVLVTGENKVDLADFFAITGSDSSRKIHQAIFVAMSDDKRLLCEHSLLVSGHFDKPRIYRFATENGATMSWYRGIEIAEIKPFGRERERFSEVRWLAILNSSVLAFGSIATTKTELDRFLDHSQSDESFLSRLDHLRSKDQTWCVLAGSVGKLSVPAREQEIRATLAAIDPELADSAISAEEFEFGLFYGRKVEFEYFLRRALVEEGRDPIASSNPAKHEQVWPNALLSALDAKERANTIHGVIAISVPRFEKWLTRISNRQ